MSPKDRRFEVAQARAALVVAAMRRSLLTYGELGRAIGVGGVGLRNEMRLILDDLSDDCQSRGEPSLAALVVNKDTGEPGAGWTNGPDTTWQQEVRLCFRHWPPA